MGILFTLCIRLFFTVILYQFTFPLQCMGVLTIEQECVCYAPQSILQWLQKRAGQEVASSMFPLQFTQCSFHVSILNISKLLAGKKFA